MKPRRFNEEQIIGILKQAKNGMKIFALCSSYKISDVTFYTWRKKYSDMKVSDAESLKKLEYENRRLKLEIAKVRVENMAIVDVLSKSW